MADSTSTPDEAIARREEDALQREGSQASNNTLARTAGREDRLAEHINHELLLWSLLLPRWASPFRGIRSSIRP